MDLKKPVVLVAPLNWGLGHATRCIPIIRELIAANAKVFIAASGSGEHLLKATFPDLEFINLPSYSISYPANSNMARHMLLHSPGLLGSILIEHRNLKKIISKYGITHVISDNRFGLYSKNIYSAFITHQVKIMGGKKLKFLEPLLFRINKYFIQHFNELWIPDLDAENSLSGALSDVAGINFPVKHLGILSRFTQRNPKNVKKYDVIAVVSGPEPQRSIFEKLLLEKLKQTSYSYLIVRGLPGNTGITDSEHMINHLPDEQLLNFLHQDTLWISRPGYSTLMDLAVLQHQNILFIPTPGQTEQEYLAEYHKRKTNCKVMSQLEFEKSDLLNTKELSKLFVQSSPGNNPLKSVISEFLLK